MECFLNMSKAFNPSLGFAEERKKGGRERERKVGVEGWKEEEKMRGEERADSLLVKHVSCELETIISTPRIHIMKTKKAGMVLQVCNVHG